jgi:hypothetical protein
MILVLTSRITPLFASRLSLNYEHEYSVILGVLDKSRGIWYNTAHT